MPLPALDDAFTELAQVHEAVWTLPEPGILELCRLRIAHLLAGDDELALRSPAAADEVSEEQIAELAQWPTSPLFTPPQRACLAFAEQFSIDITGVTKAHVDAVLEHLDPAALYGLVQALTVFDETQRLRLALDRLGLRQELL